jgi:peptide deformylase
VSAGENELVREAAEAFVAELQHWRDVAGLAKKALSERMGYDPSYVGKIESGNARPTADFAKRADQVLHAGGALWRRWKECDLTTRQASRERPVEPEDIKPVESVPAPATGLVVEHDHAELRYENGMYHATQRRKLRNVGQEPISRYLVRISVDRYPGDPERSNALYREHPLTWPELRLHARCGDDEMAWRVKHDRDAFKEVWLLFENDYGHFPLYPGKSVWIEYGYSVSEQKWGRWFQRAVRLPTERLSVRLVFPQDLEPKVWGMETSMTAEAYPFRTAIEREEEDGHQVFCWATDCPPLHARYRLEWNFKAKQEDDVTTATASAMKPSEKMTSIGIRQKGSPILEKPTRPFDLPAEAEDARRTIAELHSAIERAMSIHHFAKGLGVAAPQIGIGRSAALVRTPNGKTITLLNPQVIEDSAETDEQYEGCWSFFDVRGKVLRPLAIHVEHQDVDGIPRITIFQDGVARLVAHEIDHLLGLLYTGRMGPSGVLVPVSEYVGTGKSWTYT